ncbi:hypothetical protein SVA_1089 [Sulfurifustis variabilis]|uniref:Uncharacterized protein n=1 Tax=Sulfurifustis variabilis TaxID=1675686 RepID=A0A1B4V2B3_9GAMM|nr:hypothetical protein [Sulfurifustis variabilis]BAU47668.1 hypothetical protein SVA_1089 [Sulfurifustis variabilis]
MADEKPKHKPSPKRTLEEVLKSLQDLIRNDIVSRRDADTAPSSPPAPPAGSIPDAFDRALDKLDALITHELIEPARHARENPPIDTAALPSEAEWPLDEPPPPEDLRVPPDTGPVSRGAAGSEREDDAGVEGTVPRYGLQDALPFEEPPPSLASLLKEEKREESDSDAAPATPAATATVGEPTGKDRPTGEAETGAASEPTGAGPPETVSPSSSGIPGSPALDDGIPVLREIAELEAGHELATPEQARAIAIRVVARLNIERRKAGEPPLDIRTIERLQKLLRDALAPGDPPRGA